MTTASKKAAGPWPAALMTLSIAAPVAPAALITGPMAPTTASERGERTHHW